MDILTIIGLASGFVVIGFGILSGGELISFFDPGSVFVTIGGTIAALMVNFPLKSLAAALSAYPITIFSKAQNPLKIIDNITELAELARKSGLLSLEEKAKEYKDEFLKRSIMAIIDSHDPQTVRETLETELSYIEERHGASIAVCEKGAAYGPAFGMIGTLIGLINMLKQLDKPETLGPNMSIALVTTFYGSVLANVFFLPIAGKLKVLNENEMFCKQLIIEGIISIQVGENPRLIKEKLLGYLPSKMKKKGLKNLKDEPAEPQDKKGKKG